MGLAHPSIFFSQRMFSSFIEIGSACLFFSLRPIEQNLFISASKLLEPGELSIFKDINFRYSLSYEPQKTSANAIKCVRRIWLSVYLSCFQHKLAKPMVLFLWLCNEQMNWPLRYCRGFLMSVCSTLSRHL